MKERVFAMEFYHVPVLWKETVDMLGVRDGGVYVDGTLGGCGHALEVCRRMGSGRLIGIDRDADALENAQERLKDYLGQVTFVHRNYADIKDILQELQVEAIDGAMLDLGVSSYQLDNGERGFSYMHDAPLDMRMNRDDKTSAYDVINGYSESDLARVIRRWGEERFASSIARSICKAREISPVETTFQLSEIIKQAIPAKNRRQGPHPAKRTFQAIRIEVNQELEKLEKALRDMFDVLKPGGHLAVITFHSLEDRIAKEVWRSLCEGCTCPKSFPVCVCGKEARGEALTRKPLQASEEELECNPRARSAKLRGIRKR